MILHGRQVWQGLLSTVGSRSLPCSTGSPKDQEEGEEGAAKAPLHTTAYDLAILVEERLEEVKWPPERLLRQCRRLTRRPPTRASPGSPLSPTHHLPGLCSAHRGLDGAQDLMKNEHFGGGCGGL
jgi:hypothetical protein